MAERALREEEVHARTGLSRTTRWRKEREGTFPRRRKIHGNINAWLESEIEKWLATRPVVGVADGGDS